MGTTEEIVRLQDRRIIQYKEQSNALFPFSAQNPWTEIVTAVLIVVPAAPNVS
jgi:hypothetical protein